jgi:hypothetical protein
VWPNGELPFARISEQGATARLTLCVLSDLMDGLSPAGNRCRIRPSTESPDHERNGGRFRRPPKSPPFELDDYAPSKRRRTSPRPNKLGTRSNKVPGSGVGVVDGALKLRSVIAKSL